MNARQTINADRRAMRRAAAAALAASGCLWALAAVAGAVEQPTHTDAREIERLVEQLGAAGYQAREQAQAKLVEIGPPAVEALEKALRSDDLEVRQRAQKALAEIQKQVAERASREILKQVVWHTRLASSLSRPPAAAGKVLLTVGADGKLRALEAKSGRALWEVAANSECDPLVSGGTVYVLDKADNVLALDAATGQARKGFRGWAVFSSPALAAGVIYARGFERSFWATDAATGERKWEAPFEGQAGFGPPPAVTQEAVYVPTVDGKIIALDRATGKALWSASVGAGNIAGLEAAGGQVLAWCGGVLAALDARTGQSRWQHAVAPAAAGGAQIKAQLVVNGKQVALTPAGGGLACADETVYLAAGERVLALDAKTGRAKWTHSPKLQDGQQPAPGMNVIQLGGRAQVRVMVQAGANGVLIAGSGHSQLTPPVVHEGVLYFGSGEGLHAVDLKTRQQLWKFQTPAAVSGRPTIADGVVYFATCQAAGGQKPTLYALRLKGRPGQ